MADSTADILRKARDHIAQPGMWIQGRFFTVLAGHTFSQAPRPCCPLGAIGLAVGQHPDWGHPRYRAARNILSRALGSCVPKWNDTPGRTQAEVVALFDKAIELAEQEECHG